MQVLLFLTNSVLYTNSFNNVSNNPTRFENVLVRRLLEGS